MTPLAAQTTLTLAIVVACAVACSEKRTPPPAPASSAVATAPSSSAAGTIPAPSAPTPLASATPSPPSEPSDAPAEPLVPTTTCRAITVKGSVTAEGGKRVLSGDVLDRPGWLDLGPSAELAVKHAETSREVVFHGPGRVLPCDRGEERFLVTRGQAITATWAGARPGSEVLIATPLAVVRYGDATLDVRVGERTLSVQAAIGDAFIDVGDGTGGERVPSGKHAERQGDAVDVKALVAACEAAAQASETLARGVLSPGGSKAPLGERASAHVRGRRAARMKCAIAGAALGTLEKGQDRDDLGRSVAGAEARWRGIPSAIRR